MAAGWSVTANTLIAQGGSFAVLASQQHEERISSPGANAIGSGAAAGATAGLEHPDTLKAMNNLASSYYATGRKDEALKLFEEVLPLRRKVNGPEHPDTLMAMMAAAAFASYYMSGRKYADMIKIMPILFVLCLVRANAITFAFFVILYILADKVRKHELIKKKTY